MRQALRFLRESGTAGSGHVNGSLYAHLLGTYRLLHSWGCDRAVCLGGLFHSVYGTVFYPLVHVQTTRREEVRRLIGHEAERLAYLFGHIRRPDGLWEALGSGSINPLCGAVSLAVTPPEAQALLEIECANLLEQGLGHDFLASVRHGADRGANFLRPSVEAAINQTLGQRAG